jgi:hypothetical protein
MGLFLLTLCVLRSKCKSAPNLRKQRENPPCAALERPLPPLVCPLMVIPYLMLCFPQQIHLGHVGGAMVVHSYP